MEEQPTDAASPEEPHPPAAPVEPPPFEPDLNLISLMERGSKVDPKRIWVQERRASR